MTKLFNPEFLMQIINNNVYVKNSFSNKKKDFNSLSYLIKKDISQSDCIKLGNGVERVIQDIILECSLFENIKTSFTKKGDKEKDHLFKDTSNKIIYYAELKSNINLDTEKSKSTYLKCQFIFEELKETYPEYEIRWCLLAYRYINKVEIPKIVANKYSNISSNLFGINEYLEMLGIEMRFDENSYIKFLNDVSDAMFEKISNS